MRTKSAIADFYGSSAYLSLNWQVPVSLWAFFFQLRCSILLSNTLVTPRATLSPSNKVGHQHHQDQACQCTANNNGNYII